MNIRIFLHDGEAAAHEYIPELDMSTYITLLTKQTKKKLLTLPDRLLLCIAVKSVDNNCLTKRRPYYIPKNYKKISTHHLTLLTICVI